MNALPPDVVPYKRTRTFTTGRIPAGLLRSHTTKAGVWGRIHVEQGALRYRILSPTLKEIVLTPDRDGIVEPEVPHEVEPIGEVAFFVEFHRKADR